MHYDALLKNLKIARKIESLLTARYNSEKGTNVTNILPDQLPSKEVFETTMLRAILDNNVYVRYYLENINNGTYNLTEFKNLLEIK